MADYNESDKLIDNGQFLLAAPTRHTGLRLHGSQRLWSSAVVGSLATRSLECKFYIYVNIR